MADKHQIYKDAEDLYNNAEYSDALLLLKSGFLLDNEYIPFYELTSKALMKIPQGEDEAEMFQKAVADFSSYVPFFDLGYHFVDMANWEMAKVFLQRASQLAPDNVDVAFEYALALASSFEIEAARAAIAKTSFHSDFWASYKYCFYSLLLNDKTEEVKEFIRQIREQIYVKPAQSEDDTFALFKLNELQNISRRLAAVGTPDAHIAHWHFIQYAGVLLDFMEDEGIAAGRWVYVFLTPGHVKNLMEKLHYVLQESPIEVSHILYTNDRNSELIATIAANMMSLPAEVLTYDNYETSNALIITSDASEFNSWQDLRVMNHAQVTFALWMNWTEECLFCPDIVGMLAQAVYLPWEAAIKVNQTTGEETVDAKTDNRATSVIAAEYAQVQSAHPEVDVFTEKYLPFYLQNIALLNLAQKQGARSYFTIESALSGSHLH